MCLKLGYRKSVGCFSDHCLHLHWLVLSLPDVSFCPEVASIVFGFLFTLCILRSTTAAFGFDHASFHPCMPATHLCLFAVNFVGFSLGQHFGWAGILLRMVYFWLGWCFACIWVDILAQMASWLGWPVYFLVVGWQSLPLVGWKVYWQFFVTTALKGLFQFAAKTTEFEVFLGCWPTYNIYYLCVEMIPTKMLITHELCMIPIPNLQNWMLRMI